MVDGELQPISEAATARLLACNGVQETGAANRGQDSVGSTSLVTESM
jgi:hypothetical protein